VASNPKFYTDENVPAAVAAGLRLRGVDVITALEAGLLGVDDDVHLAFAIRENRILFTRDVDFVILGQSNFDHPGIVYATRPLSIGEVVGELLLIHGAAFPDELRGRIYYI